MEDHTILATEENFGAVSVCPGGIVHINLAHLTLKLLPADFEKFSDLVAKAKLNFARPKRTEGKPHLQVVTSEPESDDNPRKT
ncbi:MAG: hypothetical protein M0T73_13435 [Deltaproteobacteria bacterium]|nr:hypothetical protein [Deltaproteobacteria bacterium]